MKIRITSEIHEKAMSWSDFTGNEFSIRGEDAMKSYTGNLAEVVFQMMFPTATRISETDRHADFILDGERIDIKDKERTVFCQPNYEVSIEARQKECKVDFYAFYSLNNKEGIIEYLGMISKREYFEKATFLKAGTIDKSNNWEVLVDCYNLPVSKLIKITEL